MKTKKIWLFMLAGTLAACSDNDGASGGGDDTTAILLKKTVQTAPDGSEYISQYSYNDNQLTSVTHNNSTNENYGYSGSLLTDIRFYKDGGLIERDEFLYDASGNFAERVKHYYDLANPANNYAIKTTYAYAGNIITAIEYKGDDSSQTTLENTITLTQASNGNIVKYQDADKTINYSFDNNNNPIKEVYMFNLLLLSNYKDGANNIATRQTTLANGTVTNAYNTYIYNTDNYPASATQTTESGSVYTTTYTYY